MALRQALEKVKIKSISKKYQKNKIKVGEKKANGLS